jgi:hypothetical protein
LFFHDLGDVFHDLKLLLLHVKLKLWVSLFILVSLFVDALALPFETLLVFALLVIDVLLKAVMHFECGVETIFDRVVGSTWHVSSDQAPFLTILQEQFHEALVFFESPLVLDDIWVKVVVPSFSALLSNSTRQVRSNEVPVLGTKLLDHLSQLVILFFSPGAFTTSLNVILLLKTQVFKLFFNFH